MDVSKTTIFESNVIFHIVVQYSKVKSISKKDLLFPVAHYHSILQWEDNIVEECVDGS